MNSRLRAARLFVAIVAAVLLPIEGRAETLALCPKEVPRITLENISPPFDQYDYFQNRQFFPFQYAASSFSLINAWWLAEASTLVYSDAPYAWQRLRQAGFDQIQFIERGGTTCFVAANKQFAILAFRGSEIWRRGEHFDAERILADLKTNIDIRLSEWPKGGRVHSGFKTALEEVWTVLQPEIERLQNHGVKIWLTGHSLGAALATLAADRLTDVQGLYTFGSPRVGDKGFQAHFRVPAYRVVNGQDIVATVPGEGPFLHVGKLIPIGSEKSLQSGQKPVEAPGNAPCFENTLASETTQEDVKIDSGTFIPDAFRDHNPMLYDVHLWNTMVEQRYANGGR
jgi:triacylglycerol lipase